jgi:hypothetical protein
MLKTKKKIENTTIIRQHFFSFYSYPDAALLHFLFFLFKCYAKSSIAAFQNLKAILL